jgi:ribosomal protein L11 methyltransferase
MVGGKTESFEIPTRGEGSSPGEHPTVQLCRSFLTERARSRRIESLLDVGTGSGALAIHAARLGAPRIVAIDRDPTRASEAEASIARTGVPQTIEVRALPAALVDGRFDVVIANLWGDDLLAAAPDLARLTAPGGDLFCSGIRLWQAPPLRRILESSGLRVAGLRAAEGWGALHLRRPAAQ